MPEYLIIIVGWALILTTPTLFLVFGWIIFRWVRKRGISLSGSFFILAGFSAATVGFALLLNRFSRYLQFNVESTLLASFGYALGLGWLAMQLLAVLAMILAIGLGITTYLSNRWRSS